MDIPNTKLFEFTTQEETQITNVLEELAQITCTLLSEGVSSNDKGNITVFNIIYCILESNEVGRGEELSFAITNVIEENSQVKILFNQELITPKAVLFLERLLSQQLSFFRQNTTRAIDLFKKKNLMHQDEEYQLIQ